MREAIKKIELLSIEGNYPFDLSLHESLIELKDKLNELVDAVNENILFPKQFLPPSDPSRMVLDE